MRQAHEEFMKNIRIGRDFYYQKLNTLPKEKLKWFF